MTKPGPPPTPTEKLKRRGSWRAKARTQEPRPKPARPRAPAWLSKDAKAVFHALGRQLYAEGMAARLDEGALAIYADLFIQYRDASAFVSKYGAVYAVPGRVGPDGKPGPSTGFRTYPQAERARFLAGDLMRMGDRLGLTPSSRSRLVGGVSAPAAPQFEHYFQPVRIVP